MPRVLVTLLFVYSLGGIGIAATDVWANDIRNERLQFSRGEVSAMTKGKVTGREIVDYKLSARAGSA
jgi:hypothetical protein